MSTRKRTGKIAYYTVALSVLFASCAGGPPSRKISANSEDEFWRPNGNLDAPAAADRHGCCSEHGGACGCGKGKVQCCDGTSSSRCSCE